MLKINIGDKELKIKYAYEPTLKERLISRLIKVSDSMKGFEDGDFEKLEDLLLFLPELLLVGLQTYHSDEYGYDYDTKSGKGEQMEKMFKLIDEYFNQDGADFLKLFELLQGELLADGFLKSLFRREQELQAETAKTLSHISAATPQS